MHISSGRWVYGFFLTLLTAFLWGILPIKLKQVLQVMDPITLLAISNDALLTTKIKAQMLTDNAIPGSRIKVVTDNGIVYLMGIVNERESKVAIAVARTTAGVVKVVNVLEVVGEDETRRLDNLVLGARTAPPPSAPVENR